MNRERARGRSWQVIFGILSASECNYDVRLLNHLMLSNLPRELKLLLGWRG